VAIKTAGEPGGGGPLMAPSAGHAAGLRDLGCSIWCRSSVGQAFPQQGPAHHHHTGQLHLRRHAVVRRGITPGNRAEIWWSCKWRPICNFSSLGAPLPATAPATTVHRRSSRMGDPSESGLGVAVAPAPALPAPRAASPRYRACHGTSLGRCLIGHRPPFRSQIGSRHLNAGLKPGTSSGTCASTSSTPKP
jgi:hypothetical protein